jgi:TP901 family phage tail tape measure protein
MAEYPLFVRFKFDGRQFNAGLKGASARLQAFGAKASAVGARLRTISIPLGIAGGAAVKMAADFDKSMTQIKSLVGVAGAEVDAMGERAKQMASDTATSANEAAEALFFITSAGLRGEEAMSVLGASLKAAAVGLGDTKTVADLATSAMNAYGSSVLSATDATDVMVSAVREGKLEASELAGSMGRVLPIASAMGVSFDEVGAAFAALSRTGTNAAEAATQIRGIFTGLLKPTKEATDTLEGMGLSAKGLREQLREEGLLSTLKTLKENFEGNDEAAQKVFENVRALSGIMDLLGANAGTTNQIFERMTDSLGATDTAFNTLAESSEFKLRKAINETKNSFMETGQVLLEALLPHLQDLAETLTDLFKKFQSLDKDAQKNIITLGEIILVAPFVVTAVGSMATAFGTLGKAVAFLTDTAMLPRLAKLLTSVASVGAIPLLFGGDEDRRDQELIAKQIEINKRNALALNNAIKTFGDRQVSIASPEGLNLGGQTAIARTAGDLKELETAAVGAATAFKFPQLQKVNEDLDKTRFKAQNLVDALAEFGINAGTLFNAVGQSIAGAFNSMLQGENVFQALKRYLGGLVKQLLAAAMAAALLSALLPSDFGALGGGKTDFKSLFGRFSGFGATAFASGGIVSTPTLGLVGEYSGARQNPEVIAPLDRLQSMLGNNGGNVNVTGQFRLDGQDLVVALERANKQRDNFV